MQPDNSSYKNGNDAYSLGRMLVDIIKLGGKIQHKRKPSAQKGLILYTGTTENIILNQPVPIGTGLPGLLVKIIGPLIKKESDKKIAKSDVVERVNK